MSLNEVLEGQAQSLAPSPTASTIPSTTQKIIDTIGTMPVSSTVKKSLISATAPTTVKVAATSPVIPQTTQKIIDTIGSMPVSQDVKESLISRVAPASPATITPTAPVTTTRVPIISAETQLMISRLPPEIQKQIINSTTTFPDILRKTTITGRIGLANDIRKIIMDKTMTTSERINAIRSGNYAYAPYVTQDENGDFTLNVNKFLPPVINNPITYTNPNAAYFIIWEDSSGNQFNGFVPIKDLMSRQENIVAAGGRLTRISYGNKVYFSTPTSKDYLKATEKTLSEISNIYKKGGYAPKAFREEVITSLKKTDPNEYMKLSKIPGALDVYARESLKSFVGQQTPEQFSQSMTDYMYGTGMKKLVRQDPEKAKEWWNNYGVFDLGPAGSATGDGLKKTGLYISDVRYNARSGRYEPTLQSISRFEAGMAAYEKMKKDIISSVKAIPAEERKKKFGTSDITKAAEYILNIKLLSGAGFAPTQDIPWASAGIDLSTANELTRQYSDYKKRGYSNLTDFYLHEAYNNVVAGSSPFYKPYRSFDDWKKQMQSKGAWDTYYSAAQKRADNSELTYFINNNIKPDPTKYMVYNQALSLAPYEQAFKTGGFWEGAKTVYTSPAMIDWVYMPVITAGITAGLGALGTGVSKITSKTITKLGVGSKAAGKIGKAFGIGIPLAVSSPLIVQSAVAIPKMFEPVQRHTRYDPFTKSFYTEPSRPSTNRVLSMIPSFVGGYYGAKWISRPHPYIEKNISPRASNLSTRISENWSSLKTRAGKTGPVREISEWTWMFKRPKQITAKPFIPRQPNPLAMNVYGRYYGFKDLFTGYMQKKPGYVSKRMLAVRDYGQALPYDVIARGGSYMGAPSIRDIRAWAEMNYYNIPTEYESYWLGRIPVSETGIMTPGSIRAASLFDKDLQIRSMKMKNNYILTEKGFLEGKPGKLIPQIDESKIGMQPFMEGDRPTAIPRELYNRYIFSRRAPSTGKTRLIPSIDESIIGKTRFMEGDRAAAIPKELYNRYAFTRKTNLGYEPSFWFYDDMAPGTYIPYVDESLVKTPRFMEGDRLSVLPRELYGRYVYNVSNKAAKPVSYTRPFEFDAKAGGNYLFQKPVVVNKPRPTVETMKRQPTINIPRNIVDAEPFYKTVDYGILIPYEWRGVYDVPITYSQAVLYSPKRSRRSPFEYGGIASEKLGVKTRKYKLFNGLDFVEDNNRSRSGADIFYENFFREEYFINEYERIKKRNLAFQQAHEPYRGIIPIRRQRQIVKPVTKIKVKAAVTPVGIPAPGVLPPSWIPSIEPPGYIPVTPNNNIPPYIPKASPFWFPWMGGKFKRKGSSEPYAVQFFNEYEMVQNMLRDVII